MTIFEDKERSHEAKFAKEEELKFKSISRRNKLLAMWAANKMNKSQEDLKEYTTKIIGSYIDKPDDQSIISIIKQDLKDLEIEISTEEIQKEMLECHKRAIIEINNQ